MPKKGSKRNDVLRGLTAFHLIALIGVLLSIKMAPDQKTIADTESLPNTNNNTLPEACKDFKLADDVFFTTCKIIEVIGAPFNHETRRCYRAIQKQNATDHISVFVRKKTHHDVHVHNTKMVHYHSIEKNSVAKGVEKKAPKLDHRAIFHIGKHYNGHRGTPDADRSNVCRLNYRK